tara:strand:+ start:93134 stop:93463 length:330 start_codon:yes stop_codon:yes gene_type:complete
MWLSLVERCVRDAEVASSNLVIPTSAKLFSQKYLRPFEISDFQFIFPGDTFFVEKTGNHVRFLSSILLVFSTRFGSLFQAKSTPDGQRLTVLRYLKTLFSDSRSSINYY